MVSPFPATGTELGQVPGCSVLVTAWGMLCGPPLTHQHSSVHILSSAASGRFPHQDRTGRREEQRAQAGLATDGKGTACRTVRGQTRGAAPWLCPCASTFHTFHLRGHFHPGFCSILLVPSHGAIPAGPQ